MNPIFKLVICSVFLVIPPSLFAQNNTLNFILPLTAEPIVTGNYAELRPNHFHAGIDFRTDGVKNLPIRCVADGYVSRIKISSGGYGKVLYITHSNGYTTVYAHQKDFSQQINTFIKSKQIEQKKNDIEVFPDTNALLVKKGDIIGFTGNTGSSSGPHLHFEIRDSKTEIPINPLLVYDIKDNIKPEITYIAIYNTSDTNNIQQSLILPVRNTEGKLSLLNKTIITSQNTFAIGFSGFDRANGTTNKNNIYEAKLFLDDRLVYHHQLNNISFDEARYVNVFSEKYIGNKIQKCFAPTCYSTSIYKTLVNGGKILLEDTLSHKIQLQVFDEKGNANTLLFYIKTKQLNGYKTNTVIKPNVLCNQDALIKKDNIEVNFKAGTLSKTTFVAAYINKLGKVVIGTKEDALLKPAIVAFKVSDVIIGREHKMVMMVENNYIGGTYANGWLKAETKNLGVFDVLYDTISPKINLALKNKENISQQTSLRFKVSDNISGIGEYHLYINNVWTIAEYDAKSNSITVYLNEQTPRGSVTIKLVVADKVGNIAQYEFLTNR